METGNAVSKNRAFKEEEGEKGEFRFIYKLDSKDKTLFSGVDEVSIISSPEKKNTVKMEIYELL